MASVTIYEMTDARDLKAIACKLVEDMSNNEGPLPSGAQVLAELDRIVARAGRMAQRIRARQRRADRGEVVAQW